MVRISDILKQGGRIPEPDREKKEDKYASIPFSEKLPKEEAQEYTQKIENKATAGISFTKVTEQEKTEAEKEMQVARAMHEMQLNPEDSLKVYNRALEVIKEILNKVKSETPLDLKDSYAIVENIVDRMVLGDKELISLITSATEENYLYAHMVNTCILAIDVGLGLGYNKSRLNELGLGAFLHDVGMVKVMDFVQQKRTLTPAEYGELKKHPLYGSDILSRINDIQEAVVDIAKQEHERINGSGYPEGLENDQIYEYAKVVTAVDVYEALTHPRPHRKAMDPHAAVKELLEMNSEHLFEASILKLLINRTGLYPIGSWIELNTGEIGKVISSNTDFPLRPKVHLLFGPDRKRLPKIKPLDLIQQTTLFIKHSINPQELNLKL